MGALLSKLGIGQQQEEEPQISTPRKMEDYFAGGKNLGNNLNQYQSGKPMDFNQDLADRMPKDRKSQSILSMLQQDPQKTLNMIASNLGKANSNNKDRYGVGALLGQAFVDTNNQADQEYLNRQSDLEKLLKGGEDRAKSNRDYGFNEKKEANDVDYKNRYLGEMGRNNDLDYKSRMAGVGVQREAIAQGKYGSPIIDDNGNPYSLNGKTGEMMPLNLPDGVSFKMGRGKTGGAAGLKSVRSGDVIAGQNYLSSLLGNTDLRGKASPDAGLPLDPAQQQAIMRVAQKLFQSGEAASIQEGVDKALDNAGGLGALDEGESNLFSKNRLRQFPKDNIGKLQEMFGMQQPENPSMAGKKTIAGQPNKKVIRWDEIQ